MVCFNAEGRRKGDKEAKTDSGDGEWKNKEGERSKLCLIKVKLGWGECM